MYCTYIISKSSVFLKLFWGPCSCCACSCCCFRRNNYNWPSKCWLKMLQNPQGRWRSGFWSSSGTWHKETDRNQQKLDGFFGQRKGWKMTMDQKQSAAKIDATFGSHLFFRWGWGWFSFKLVGSFGCLPLENPPSTIWKGSPKWKGRPKRCRLSCNMFWELPCTNDRGILVLLMATFWQIGCR